MHGVWMICEENSMFSINFCIDNFSVLPTIENETQQFSLDFPNQWERNLKEFHVSDWLHAFGRKKWVCTLKSITVYFGPKEKISSGRTRELPNFCYTGYMKSVESHFLLETTKTMKTPAKGSKLPDHLDLFLT